MNAGAESEGPVGLRRDASSDEAALRRSNEMSIISGDPTPEELAAVTAVIEALAQEHDAGELDGPSAGQSAWQRSQRATRATLHPGYGAWRGFSA
jgi:hypothetical protein